MELKLKLVNSKIAKLDPPNKKFNNIPQLAFKREEEPPVSPVA